LFLGIFLLFACVSPGATDAGAAEVTLAPPRGPVPGTFFGMHIHRAGSTAWPAAPFASWRFWDTYSVWPWLEPVKGEWHFERLDKLVSLAEEHRVEVLLPLALSPEWASARPGEKSAYGKGMAAEPGDIEDWKKYVRTIGTRYRGKVRYYEMWNEPNLKNFYSGDLAGMLALSQETYNVLKGIDPENVIVSPSPSGGYKETAYKWLDDFLSKGGGDFADVIGYHFYVAPGPPELMAAKIARVREIMGRHGLRDKPLWNTESGWFIDNRQTPVKPTPSGSKSKVLDADEAAAYVARAHLIGWASGVDRFYYYAWDNKEMGLVEPDGKTLKPAAVAYKVISDWIVGATMKSCRSTKEGTWICELVRENGYFGWILWHPSRTGTYRYSDNWKIVQARKLDGTRRDMTSEKAVEIGPAPVLVENQAK
jgi:hypothetical protein